MWVCHHMPIGKNVKHTQQCYSAQVFNGHVNWHTFNLLILDEKDDLIFSLILLLFCTDTSGAPWKHFMNIGC